jgi:RimJ/RimL family protein N-acetyltransferase
MNAGSGAGQDPEDQRILTQRLELLPCRLDVARASLEDPHRVGPMLDVTLPEPWPGQDLQDILPLHIAAAEADPSAVVWGVWYLVVRDDRSLVGDLGFKGGPDPSGRVEIGYGVAPAHRRQGYATEAVRGLILWAFARPEVRTILAECLPDNLASIRVLERVGMHRVRQGPETISWRLVRPAIPGR